MTDTTTLFAQAAIQKKVYELWEQVFLASNRVLRNANVYGFELMEIIAEPNLDQLRRSLSVVEFILDRILDDYLEQLDHDQCRMALNAREQLRKLEHIAIALKGNDELEFNRLIKELDGQLAI